MQFKTNLFFSWVEMKIFNNLSYYLEYKLLTSVFFSIQSPATLLKILDKLELLSKGGFLKNKIKIGDRVYLFDVSRNRKFHMILVCNKRNNPNDGLISIYSPLGSSILGLEVNDTFNLYILGKTRRYEIICVKPEKSISSIVS